MAGFNRINSGRSKQTNLPNSSSSNSSSEAGKGKDAKLSDAEKKKLAKQQAKLDAEIKKQAKQDGAGTSGTAETPEYPAVGGIAPPNSPVHPMLPHSSSLSDINPYSKYNNSEAGHAGSGAVPPGDSSSSNSAGPLTMQDIKDGIKDINIRMAGGQWIDGRGVNLPGDQNTLHSRWIPGYWKEYQSPERPMSPSSPSSPLSLSDFPVDPRSPRIAAQPHSQEPASPASTSGGHSLSEHVPIWTEPGPSSPATRPGPYPFESNTPYDGPRVGSDRHQPPEGMFDRRLTVAVPPSRYGLDAEGRMVRLNSSPDTTPPLTPTAPGWLGENRAFFRDNPDFLQSNPTFFKDHPAIVRANPWLVQEYPHFAQEYPDIFTLPEPAKKNALSTKAKIGLAAVTGLAVGAAVTGVVLRPDEDSTEGSVQKA